MDRCRKVRKEFAEIHSIENVKSDTIAADIKYMLKNFNIPLSKYRGQCYSGSSNMTVYKKGVSNETS